MKLLKTSLFLQLTFVFMMTSGFTCQKKYPMPPPESEQPATSETPSENNDSSSENSNSPSETASSAEDSSQKPVDKTEH